MISSVQLDTDVRIRASLFFSLDNCQGGWKSFQVTYQLLVIGWGGGGRGDSVRFLSSRNCNASLKEGGHVLSKLDR